MKKTFLAALCLALTACGPRQPTSEADALALSSPQVFHLQSLSRLDSRDTPTWQAGGEEVPSPQFFLLGQEYARLERRALLLQERGKVKVSRTSNTFQVLEPRRGLLSCWQTQSGGVYVYSTLTPCPEFKEVAISAMQFRSDGLMTSTVTSTDGQPYNVAQDLVLNLAALPGVKLRSRPQDPVRNYVLSVPVPLCLYATAAAKLHFYQPVNSTCEMALDAIGPN